MQCLTQLVHNAIVADPQEMARTACAYFNVLCHRFTTSVKHTRDVFAAQEANDNPITRQALLDACYDTLKDINSDDAASVIAADPRYCFTSQALQVSLVAPLVHSETMTKLLEAGVPRRNARCALCVAQEHRHGGARRRIPAHPHPLPQARPPF